MTTVTTAKKPTAPDRGAPDTDPSATTHAAAYRRVLRRETHASRSGSTIVVLIVLAIVTAYVGIEAVCSALGIKPLLFSPVDVVATLVSAVADQGGLVLAVGIVTGLVGLVLIVLGLKAGRRGRHTIDDPRVAVVVDDQVVAASLARRARLAGGLAPGQVSAWVARSSARLTVTPATGSQVDEAAVLSAAQDDLTTIAYRPALTAQVKVSDNGRLGA